MTATATGPPAAGPTSGEAAAARPVTLPRVITSEWIKFRTLRSSAAVLGGAIVGMIAIALLVAWNTRKLSGDIQLEDLLPSATLQGYYLGQLLIGALGVLFVTGEYSTGMIRSTMTAVPTRLPVLAAKLIVFVGIVATSMIAVSVVAFVAAQGLLSHYRTGSSLSDHGVLRVVIGTGVYLTLIGLLGMAIGWVVRSTPGSLVTYIAIILVLPLIFATVLGSWGRHVAQFLPTQAGASFSTSFAPPPSLSVWAGLGVMALWVVGAFALAVVRLRRRDV